jgi:glycosyltransferase involved in cell wall biosynthesis
LKFWLVEISDFLPKVDGDSRPYRVGLLANALIESGHEVLWWSSTFNHQLRRQRFNHSVTIPVGENFRLRLLFGPGYKRSISLSRWKHNKAVAKEFGREISELSGDSQPDIIYACLPTLEVSEQAVLYAAKRTIPVVVDIRELWPDNYLSLFPEILRPMLRVLFAAEFSRARRILRLATGLVSTSTAYLNWGLQMAERDRSSTDTWFPLGSTILENGHPKASEIDTFALADRIILDGSNLIISFVGSFTRLFDFMTVLSVAREFAQSGEKRIQFLFVGDGELGPLLRKKTQGSKNVYFTGWCQKAMVDKILSLSSVGLAPYNSKVPPTLSNKPFEYMAAGLPILSSNAGELKDLIEQEGIGLHYRSNDSRELKEKILWFLSHPEEREIMGQKAKTLLKKKFSADIVYKNLVEHLVDIAKKKMV